MSTEALRRIVARTVTKTHHVLQAQIARTEHGQRSFFETDTLPWVQHVETHWTDIRAELDALLARIDNLPNFQDIQQEQRDLTTDERWKVFPLYAYGERIERNCARCPKTDALLRSIPGMTTGMFSILLPHKHIPPHIGPWKGVLRYHLALRTPADEKLCRIRVGDQQRNWQRGKSLIFDDTFQHEVWNDSDEIRVVLFVDFIRDLPLHLAIPNRLFMGIIRRSSFIQDTLRRLEAWEETLLARETRGAR